MQQPNLIGYTLPEMENALVAIGEKPFRGRQLFKWIYQTRQFDFEKMTDFQKPLRSKLLEQFVVSPLVLEKRSKSKDGTEKFLFRLHDGKPIETVLIPDGDRVTACVSSQSGCALACQFCATGTMGLLRDLTVGEIVGQLLFLRQEYGDRAFGNIVFMGMGEPLHNYENVVAAVGILTHELGFGMSPRRITISTSGVTPKIKRLSESGLNVKLALSLHAAFQHKRVKIMPVAKTHSLEKLMDAVRSYARANGHRVMIEYIVFEGFNDTEADAAALITLLHGLPYKINLLPYNPVPGLPFKRPSDEKVDWFAQQLYPHAQAVTVRKSRGRDIDAACGQLAVRETRV